MKLPLSAVVAFAALTLIQATASAQNETNQPNASIPLTEPRLDAGVPFMQALKNRKTTRDFSSKNLTAQQLSEVLWAADGINRPTGQRTAPSAIGKYSVDIYVVLPDGIYVYEPAERRLRPVAAGDFRAQAGTQDFAKTAPVNLVFVADLDKYSDTSAPDADKLLWAGIEAGAQSQNASLYCASEGLGAVVRVSIDKAGFAKAAKLRSGQNIIVAQTVGYSKPPARMHDAL